MLLFDIYNKQKTLCEDDKTKFKWYSLSTIVFPESPTMESSMRIPVKKTNVVASARER